MLDSSSIDKLLEDAKRPGLAVKELRTATQGTPVTLTPSMAAVLGTQARRTVPVLSVVVAAISDKLFVKTVRAATATATKQLQKWLAANQWGQLERKLYRAVVRDGYAALLVTWDAYRQQPLLTLREAYDGTEGVLIAGGVPINIWRLSEGREPVVHADFYDTSRIEKYVRRSGKWEPRRDLPDEVWPLDWTDRSGEPLGRALILFGDGASAVAGALQAQNDLYEALLDMTAISRTQGWPQRFISGDEQGEFLTNANGQPMRTLSGAPIRRELKLEPGSVQYLRGQNAKVSQLDAARIDRTAVDVQLELITLITGVPSYYFRGNWPSGVALVQAETRLNSQVGAYQGVCTPSLEATLQLMLRLGATFGGVVLDATQPIAVEWYPPQIETEDLVREREKATIALYTAGLLSRETALERLHPDWTVEQRAEELERLNRR